MKKSYEIMFINVVMPEAEREALVDKYCTFIAENEGTVINRDYWGTKRLAYEIQDLDEGDYYLVTFSLDATALQKLDRKIKHDERVLRHMIIRKGE